MKKQRGRPKKSQPVEFEVESIVGVAFDYKIGQILYKVKWFGYRETTWEPKDNLTNSARLLSPWSSFVEQVKLDKLEKDPFCKDTPYCPPEEEEEEEIEVFKVPKKIKSPETKVQLAAQEEQVVPPKPRVAKKRTGVWIKPATPIIPKKKQNVVEEKEDEEVEDKIEEEDEAEKEDDDEEEKEMDDSDATENEEEEEEQPKQEEEEDKEPEQDKNDESEKEGEEEDPGATENDEENKDANMVADNEPCDDAPQPLTNILTTSSPTDTNASTIEDEIPSVQSKDDKLQKRNSRKKKVRKSRRIGGRRVRTSAYVQADPYEKPKSRCIQSLAKQRMSSSVEEN